MDAWIAAHDDALVYVATDERSYLERMEARYGRYDGGNDGRIVSSQEGYGVGNVMQARGISGYKKGLDVLLDGLLLSKCDFLLRATSAVAEYAIWVNLALHDAEVDLQVWRAVAHTGSSGAAGVVQRAVLRAVPLGKRTHRLLRCRCTPQATCGVHSVPCSTPRTRSPSPVQRPRPPRGCCTGGRPFQVAAAARVGGAHRARRGAGLL